MDYLATFFFLLSAHYFPLSNFLPWKMPHPIRIVLNYVTGTVGMLAPFIWWLHQRGDTEIIMRLLGFVIAAGLAPILSYVNDAVIDVHNRANEAEERERLLSSKDVSL